MLRKTLFAGIAMALSLAVAGLAGVNPANAQEKTYVNGIDESFPPFAYMDNNGNPAGFDVDAMNWIADKMGFKVEHRPMDWNTIIPSLKTKRIDMVCSGMSVNEERSKEVNFSEPYYRSSPVLVVLPDTELTRDEIFTGNMNLGIQRGTSEAQWLEKNKEPNNWNYTLMYYDNQTMAIEDLINGRVKVIGTDDVSAMEAIAQGRKIKILAPYGEATDFAVAVRKEDNELRDLINEGYKQLKADPYWEEIKAKHNIQEFNPDEFKN